MRKRQQEFGSKAYGLLLFIKFNNKILRKMNRIVKKAVMQLVAISEAQMQQVAISGAQMQQMAISGIQAKQIW